MNPNIAGVASAFILIGVLTSATAIASPMGNLPQAITLGKVTYVSGGIGEDESGAFERAEHKFPLSLEFAQRAKPRDEFLADVDVTIKDTKGNTELSAKSDGPFLLAKLPAGEYTVIAKDFGRTKVSHVNLVANKPEHLMFVW